MPAKAVSDFASSKRQADALRSELEYMAYHCQYSAVYERYFSLPEQDRALYHSVDVLSGVIQGGIQHIKELGRGSEHLSARSIYEDKESVAQALDGFIEYCAGRKIAPRELFVCILEWARELIRMALSDSAQHYFKKAEALGIRKYPDLHALLMFKRAELLFNGGRHADAHRILSLLTEKYYLIPDRNLVSSIIFLLGKTALLTGEGRSYKALLFGGLRYFYTRDAIRLLFTGQLVKTYRHFYRAFLDRDRPFSEKLLFLMHWLYLMMSSSRLFQVTRIAHAMRLAVLAYVYFLNYGYQGGSGNRAFSDRNGRDEGCGNSDVTLVMSKKTILVTRAMGGIGDLLMMTPGFHALKAMNPDHEIFLAAPREYHHLFLGNNDVTLIDIEKGALDVSAFGKWFNFTDCPAARVESRTLPDVKLNRVDIFARSLGIRGKRLRNMDRRPRYFLTDEEKDFQRRFWEEHYFKGKKVIGVQLHTAERYKNYPYMAELVQHLSADSKVILFHDGKGPAPHGNNVVDPSPLTLRNAFALASVCDAIIAPDSSFVHFAAAFDVPCVVISGPIDGKNRIIPYPRCRFVDARRVLQCVPCWRNEEIPCKLTETKTSACMGNIKPEEIIAVIEESLRRGQDANKKYI